MALEDTTNKKSFTATAGDTQFIFDIPFFDASTIDTTNKKYGDIKVTRESSGVITQFTPKETFTVPATSGEFKIIATNNDPEQGCTVIISTAASGGEKFIIERDVSYSQQYDLQEGSTIDPTALNKALDRVVAQNQQQNDTFSRTIEFPVTDSPSRTYVVGSETERANKALGFDGSGNLTEITLSDVPTSGGDGGGGGESSPPLAANTNAGLVISNNIISAKVDNSTTKFSGGNIVVNKIDTVNLRDDAVTQAKIDDDAVTNAAIANSAVQTPQIKNYAVTFAKMQTINENKVLGRVTGAGTGDIGEIFIENEIFAVSNDHDTVASAKAIKAYADSIVPKFVSVDSVASGTSLTFNATTRSSYGDTKTWNVYNFRSNGSGNQPDFNGDRVTEIHIQISINTFAGAVGFRATYPDGNYHIIAEDAALSSGDHNYMYFVAKIPFNKTSGQSTFSLQCKKTDSNSNDTGTAKIIGVTQI